MDYNTKILYDFLIKYNNERRTHNVGTYDERDFFDLATKITKEFDLRPNKSQCFNNSFGCGSSINDTLDWPENLLCDAGIPYLSTEEANSMIYGLEYVIDNFLKGAHEKDVVLWYYKNKMSLKDIARELELTTERIRQIRNKAVRKISASDYRKEIIMFGKEKIEYDEKVKEDMYKQLKKLKEETDELAKKNADRVNIHDAGLSTRALNCLYRYTKVKYLDELTEYTIDDLIRLRNFGRNSLYDLINKMKEHGLKLKEE